MGSAPPQGDKTRYQARLEQVEPLTDTTKHFVWQVTGPRPLRFAAGQFISLHLERNGTDDVRPYSIASAPLGASPRDEPLGTRARDKPAGCEAGGQWFELCLNRVPGGTFSNYLCDLEPGAEISFEGPFGFFVPQEPLNDSVFVATGTGIAPIRGMLEDILRQGLPAGQAGTERELWLIFGVRYPQTILYGAELAALAADHPNFHFWPTLSRAPADWAGRRGHVQEHVERLIAERPDLDVYLCGLRAMVDDLRQRLKARGMNRKRIRYEKYD